MDRQSKVTFSLCLLGFICSCVWWTFFTTPPFKEGDMVQPTKDIYCPWAPLRLNPTSDQDGIREPIHLTDNSVVVVEKGGSLNSYYFFDSPDWWIRVRINKVARWCLASNLKLAESQ